MFVLQQVVRETPSTQSSKRGTAFTICKCYFRFCVIWHVLVGYFGGLGMLKNNCPYKLLLSFTPFQLTKDFTGTFYFGIVEEITNVKILLTVMELLYRAYMSVINSQMRGKKIHGNNNLLSLPLLFCCVSTSNITGKNFDIYIPLNAVSLPFLP